MKVDLFIDICSPETSCGTIIRIRRKNGWTVFRPGFVDVLKNDVGFAYRLVIMDQNWDFLVDWIGFKKELTFDA